jgi:hypothetical protein
MNAGMIEKYRSLATEDLVNIVFVDKDRYETEAIELARKELVSRGITSQTASEMLIARTQEEVAQAQKETEDLTIRNAAPLETRAKVILFVIGMVPVPPVLVAALLFIIFCRNTRGAEKTSQSWIWLFMGFCVPIGAMVVYVLVGFVGFLIRP